MGILTGILRPDGLGKGRSSAQYKFKNTGSISSGSTITMDLELGLGDFTCEAVAAEYQGFYPFSKISVVNNNVDYNADVWYNNNPAHAFTVFNRGAQAVGGLALIRFHVKNTGTGTIGSGEVVVSLWNE